ncbi:MAG: ribulose-phosphate 3-epimerase [Planctomycetes bacterium]|nr:ribulose-phosphate 3-epimerase [Planctomycetota bacterium]
MQLLEAALPYTYELHLKNTDGRFESTFGFSPDERKLGVVQVEQFRDLLLARAQSLPVSELIGYLELSGPKLGRDYSDGNLEDGLRQSLRYLKQAFTSAATSTEREVLVGGDERKKIAPAVVADESGSARVQISPSLMCADMCHLEEHVRRLEAVGVDMLHLDIMDGRFVPNMPMGLVQLGQLRKKTDLPFDVHLMTEDNEFFIEQSAKIGAQLVAIHSESAVHLDRQLQLIRQKGMKAGVALNPATPLSILKYVLDRLDFVLIMAVNPGFAGQDLVKSAIPKIAECRAMLDEHNVDIPIEVDGNVSFVNIPKMVSAGADILVAGTSSLFSKDNSLTQNMMLVRQAIEDGLQTRRAGRSKT